MIKWNENIKEFQLVNSLTGWTSSIRSEGVIVAIWVADGVRFLIAFPKRNLLLMMIKENFFFLPRLRVITGEKEVRFREYNN